MNRRHLITTCAVGLTCTAIGASLLGTASGATSPATKSARAGGARKGGLAALRRAVHAEAIVPVKGGAFATATFDRGVLTTVSGNTLTLREGTKKTTYKSVVLTIPAGAVVRLDRQPAQLSQLKAGDRVRVFHGPKKTRVAASDKQAKATGTTH